MHSNNFSKKIHITPPVIAHRGVSALAPENTLIAFSLAKPLGIRWIEFDVMLASCGEVVVIHDETLERTTNGKGNVIDYPYETLKKLDAGSWFNASFSGVSIPNLDTVLMLLVKDQLFANIEIKSILGNEEETVNRVFDVISRYPHLKNKILISSFSLTVLEWVRKKNSEILIGFLMHEWDSDWEKKCNALNAISLNLNHAILSVELIKSIHMTNRLVCAYTVNNITRAKEIFSFGVDAVFSDIPNGVVFSN